MKFNFKKIIGVVLMGATLAFSLVAGTGCSGGDVGKWFEDQYKQLTCEHKTEAIVDAVPATCTEAGLTAGIKCGDCGKMIVKQDKVPALGHTLSHFDEVEPSCLVSGLTAGDYCVVCETWVVKQERVKATGHKVVTLEAKAATCTETGLTEGQGCENCGEVYKAQEIIAAKGHTFNDNHVCTRCSACDHSYNDENVCIYCDSAFSLDSISINDLTYQKANSVNDLSTLEVDDVVLRISEDSDGSAYISFDCGFSFEFRYEDGKIVSYGIGNCGEILFDEDNCDKVFDIRFSADKSVVYLYVKLGTYALRNESGEERTLQIDKNTRFDGGYDFDFAYLPGRNPA